MSRSFSPSADLDALRITLAFPISNKLLELNNGAGTGIRPIGGGALLSSTEPLPSELVGKLNKYLEKFDPSGPGTWHHTIGEITYQVAFMPLLDQPTFSAPPINRGGVRIEGSSFRLQIGGRQFPRVVPYWPSVLRKFTPGPPSLFDPSWPASDPANELPVVFRSARSGTASRSTARQFRTTSLRTSGISRFRSAGENPIAVSAIPERTARAVIVQVLVLRKTCGIPLSWTKAEGLSNRLSGRDMTRFLRAFRITPPKSLRLVDPSGKREPGKL
jgi:hypothetical protein